MTILLINEPCTVCGEPLVPWADDEEPPLPVSEWEAGLAAGRAAHWRCKDAAQPAPAQLELAL